MMMKRIKLFENFESFDDIDDVLVSLQDKGILKIKNKPSFNKAYQDEDYEIAIPKISIRYSITQDLGKINSIAKLDSSNHKPLVLAVERLDLYFDSLVGKRVAIVGNQTSLIGKTHLVDTLISLGIKIQKVFAPEHGFRGIADNGEHVWNDRDPKQGWTLFLCMVIIENQPKSKCLMLMLYYLIFKMLEFVFTPIYLPYIM